MAKKSNIRKVNDLGGTLHIDTYLTDYSEAYILEPSMFISPSCVTNISVMKESNKYATYPRGYFWRDEAEVRPLGGRPVQVSYKVLPKTYLAEEWALEHTIDDRQRANTDNPINLDENAVNLLTQKQLIRADRIWATNFFTAGVWPHQAAGGTDFIQFDDANSKPIETIDTQKEVIAEATGFMPNKLIIGAQVKKVLRSHPDIADRIKYTGIGVADNAKLAELFDVDTVAVARSVYNAAAETNAETPVDEAGGFDARYIIDPTAMLLAYIAPTGGLDTPTAIARFSWTGLIPGAANQFGGVIERGRDDRAHSDWFQNRTAYDMKQVGTDLAVFFSQTVDPFSN
jgi:hypothetical protein